MYDAVTVLGAARFDLVFTGIGALIWLPTIDGWAAVVAQLLRPGGRLFLRDAHPMLLSMADTSAADPAIRVHYPVFGAVGPTRFDEAVSYEGDGTPLAHTTTYQWNWSIGEIVTGLIGAGLRIDSFTEHRTAPWNALEGAMVEGPPLGEYERPNGRTASRAPSPCRRRFQP